MMMLLGVYCADTFHSWNTRCHRVNGL